MIYVTDLARMRAFYAACGGLQVVDDASEHCTLATEGWELTLVLVPADVAAGIEVATPPVRRASAPVKLGVPVEDLVAAIDAVEELGGVVDDRDEAWSYRGTRRRDVLDPEGNVVQLVAPGG